MPCIRDPAVQQAIADAYIENGGNKEQAVIAAGYSERYARGNASKLVAISGVQEKINARKSRAGAIAYCRHDRNQQILERYDAQC